MMKQIDKQLKEKVSDDMIQNMIVDKLKKDYPKVVQSIKQDVLRDLKYPQVNECEDFEQAYEMLVTHFEKVKNEHLRLKR